MTDIDESIEMVELLTEEFKRNITKELEQHGINNAKNAVGYAGLTRTLAIIALEQRRRKQIGSLGTS